MRSMKMLWGVAAAVVLAMGCNAAPLEESQGEDSQGLPTSGEVSAMGDECPPPPPPCPVACGHNGDKVRVCHHAPPDSPDSQTIELCIAVPGAEAHLREHSEDTLGCCPP
jgi:hypothetical protein